MDAFDVLMQSSKRKADELDNDCVIGIGYEGKLCGEGVDLDDPLYGTCYYGIAVRPGYDSARALQEKRQREHEDLAKSSPKDLGIRAIIVRYGPRALVWRVVVSKNGDRVSTQEWANEWEKHAIAAAGGMLRDIEPNEPLRQTFNLTNGGQGNPRVIWDGIEAFCTRKWKTFQKRLQAFVKERGTACVPQDFVTEDGNLLGNAVANVRSGAMLRGRPDEMKRREWLEALPGWAWNSWDASWRTFQRYLSAYVAECGSACVPHAFVAEDGYALGKRLGDVRYDNMYLKDKKDVAERRGWLEALPGWTWSVCDDAWNDFQRNLLAYVAKYKSANPSVRFIMENGYPLGTRLGDVRYDNLYLKDKKDVAERRAWLEALPGWTWSVHDDAWETFRQHLLAYVENSATACVHVDFVAEDGYPLGKRVSGVRLKGAHLTDKDDEAERRAWLETLPGWTWSVYDAAWETFQQYLLAYVAEHQTTRVPYDRVLEDGYRLGKKVSDVRRRGCHLKDKEDEAERRKWLEALPGWTWSAYDEAWQTFQEHLQAHVKATGSSIVTNKFVCPDGYKLGSHVQNIRSCNMFLRDNTNEATRRAWLESQPGWTSKVSKSDGQKASHADLKLFRATTHPDATSADVKLLRNDGTLLYNAHAVLRAATKRAIDDLIVSLEV